MKIKWYYKKEQNNLAFKQVFFKYVVLAGGIIPYLNSAWKRCGTLTTQKHKLACRAVHGFKGFGIFGAKSNTSLVQFITLNHGFKFVYFGGKCLFNNDSSNRGAKSD